MVQAYGFEVRRRALWDLHTGQKSEGSRKRGPRPELDVTSNFRTCTPTPTPVKMWTHTGQNSNHIFLTKYGSLSQMNITTVLRAPNCTTHVFFEKILECSFLHEKFDFSHCDPG
jgi:hypothetical protein